MQFPHRGEIWIVALDPKTRPCLVVSRNEYNKIASTITIIPLSSGKAKYHTWEMELDKKTGLENVSHLLLPQIRVAAKERFQKNIGKIPNALWHEIEEKLLFYLGF